DPSSSMYSELISRAQRRRLSGAQWQSLIERAAGGDWWAEPVSERWARKYGDFLAAWRSTFLNDKSLEAPLQSIPVRIDARTRDVWPAGTPVLVNVRVTDWWPLGYECR